MSFTLPLTRGQTGTFAELMALGMAANGAMVEGSGNNRFSYDWGVSGSQAVPEQFDMGHYLVDSARGCLTYGPRNARPTAIMSDGRPEALRGGGRHFYDTDAFRIVAPHYAPEERLIPGGTLRACDLFAIGLENLEGMVFSRLSDTQVPQALLAIAAGDMWNHAAYYQIMGGQIVAGPGYRLYRANMPQAALRAHYQTGLAQISERTNLHIMVLKGPVDISGDTPVTAGATTTTPCCPLCLRTDVFTTGEYEYGAILRAHRKVRGRTAPWCDGPAIAAALKIGVACPRCDTPTWQSDIQTGSHPCTNCRSKRGTIQQKGGTLADFRVGCEVETEGIDYTAQGGDVARKLSRKHNKGWEAKEDGSLRGRSTEFTSPPLWANKKGLEALKEGVRSMRRAGARASFRCGGHIHVGAEDLTYKQLGSLAWLWIGIQDAVMTAHVPGETRRRYCAKIREDQMAYVDTYVSQARREYFGQLTEKYSALNFAPIARIGTVEFRFWNGSVHAEEIAARAKFCAGVVALASRESFTRDNRGDNLLAIGRDPWIAFLARLGITDKRTIWHLMGAYRTEADRPTAEDIAKEAE